MVLEGVKVLELAQYGFVPSAAAVLADWGADVVKVEHPRGDPLRGVMASGLVADTGDFNFLVEHLNRNKRGIGLDLSKEPARAVFDGLVRWADVFVTSLLPSARSKLGVEPGRLREINPDLIYARGHGQGQNGPDADAAGFDSVSYWSRGGLGHMMSPAGGPLVMQRAAMGDSTAGMFLAGGIAAALYNRERTGHAATVDVSLLSTAVWVLAPDLVSTSLTGEEPPRMGAGASSLRSNPLVGAYPTSDQRWLMLNMMDFDRYWPSFCAALDRPDLARDPRFLDASQRVENAVELGELVSGSLAARPLAHWRDRLAESGCVWSFMASPTEVLDDPQVTANGYMPSHPSQDRARLAASPVQFDDEPVRIRREAPGVGRDSDQVLDELAVDDDRRAALRRSGALA